MNKSSLYITFDGLSDPLGQSQIIPYLRGIASSGYNITVISCEKADRLKTEEDRILAEFETHGIKWKHIDYNQEGNFITRFNYIRKIRQLAFEEFEKNPFSIVHCRSYLASLVGLSLKRKLGIKFIFDMRGLWADERIDGKIWNKSNPLHFIFYNYFKRAEKHFLAESDAVVSLTHNGLNYLGKQFPEMKLKQKTTVIPCCVDTSKFKNADTVRVDFPFKDTDHVLVYAGSIGTWYNTREMIECVLAWREFIPEIKLLVVTRDTAELERVLNNFSESDKSIIKWISASYSQMPSILSKAKASIFFIKPAVSKIASSPTKMAECWAVNLPIITNAGIGDNDIYFNQHHGGILVNSFTDKEYRTAGQKYLELTREKGNYRQLALDYFDSEMAVKSYTAIYKTLTPGAN